MKGIKIIMNNILIGTIGIVCFTFAVYIGCRYLMTNDRDKKISEEQRNRAAKVETEMGKYIPIEKEPEFKAKVQKNIDIRMKENTKSQDLFEIVLEETEKVLQEYKKDYRYKGENK